MTRLLTLFIASAFGLCAIAAPVPRERVPPDDAAIKQRFYDSWQEEWLEECDAKGRVTFKTKPHELSAYSFTEAGGWTWERAGELSPAAWYPVALDTTRTPMHYDAISIDKNDKPRNVIPGIFKFEGERLILAYPYPTPGWRPWNASGEYADRPKSFERRPGVVIAVLERCEHLEQSSPPEQIPKRP